MKMSLCFRFVISRYKNVISESMLPKFLDLVFWGHEHECVLELEKSESGGFWVVYDPQLRLFRSRMFCDIFISLCLSLIRWTHSVLNTRLFYHAAY